MADNLDKQSEVIEAYQQSAPGYNRAVHLFDSFARFGFNITGWRRQAVSCLGLNTGDTVVDIGCGTGLNFPFLHDLVGREGTITGVDISKAMLAEAHKLVEENKWTNIQLVCTDATTYEYPSNVNAILSTYALTLIPDCSSVVANACASLAPGGRLVILDMAWPKNSPLWWRHVLFFLRSYGVTTEVLMRRPWERVQREIEAHLDHVAVKRFWFGFFYLASGIRRIVNNGET